MEIIEKGSPEYDSARQIANARFDYRPTYICYCDNADDVPKALEMARDKKLGVRIRSGGHQHEGMCSADGVLIVDLSRVAGIAFESDNRSAWIGPGAKLEDVYQAMGEKKRLFAGGGCGHVHVGGLVQGGGWGPYLRYLGLTCDALTGVRLVTADGSRVEVTEADTGRKGRLLWAIRGGGGGNFGVATQFRFRLTAQEDPIIQFTLTWKQQAVALRVVEEWRHGFPQDHCHKLTSFCRLTVVGEGSEDSPVLIGGAFLGREDELRLILKRLLPTTFGEAELEIHTPEPELQAPRTPAYGFTHPRYQPGPPMAALRAAPAYLEKRESELQDTCAGCPFPHKVSSCFPKLGFGKDGSGAMTNFIKESKHLKDARLYLSLHSMGGEVEQGSDRSAFPFRDKPFMLQYQAWWADKEDHQLGETCIQWIRSFRKEMDPHTEGAFINFPDKDLVEGPDTPEHRKELLRIYYADNLNDLIDVKRTWDPENFFDFAMGIPTS